MREEGQTGRDYRGAAVRATQGVPGCRGGRGPEGALRGPEEPGLSRGRPPNRGRKKEEIY